MSTTSPANFTATRNACKLCAPLGATFAFRGIRGAVPFLHGSQGCATYIRRYMISHFREPVDVASSNFGEATAIFGGKDNLRDGVINVIRQYDPELIGVATTCLAETIGEDVDRLLREIADEVGRECLPPLVPVSTPSYSATHAEGFHETVRAIVATLAQGGERQSHVNIMPGFVSPADLRHLREIALAFGLEPVLLPDFSDTLDGPTWDEYHPIPEGGTPVADVQRAGTAAATIEFLSTFDTKRSAGAFLEEQFAVPRTALALPIGVRHTDALFGALERVSRTLTPQPFTAERDRLIDSFVDGHKHVFGQRAVVYGEEDLVVGIASLLAEMGIIPALCATGGHSGRLDAAIRDVTRDVSAEIVVRENVDFEDIASLTESIEPDLLIGHSKGYKLARKLGIPLVRVGFPIHDRVGGARVLHVGYRGAQQLFDRITNALLEAKQSASDVGYTYL